MTWTNPIDQNDALPQWKARVNENFDYLNDRVSQLYISVTPATLAGGTHTETQIDGYNIPGATMDAAGAKGVEIEALVSFAANGNNKRVRLYFGATVIADTGALAFNSGDLYINARVWGTGATAQVSVADLEATNKGTLADTTTVAAPAETLSGIILAKLTFENPTSGDDSTCLLFRVSPLI